MSMRRSTLSERQKAVALLVALGQFSYRQIAKKVGINRNSITLWVKDQRIQDLITKFQADIERKFLDMALESTHQDNSPLMQKAADKLSEMLDSKSQKRQLGVIKFLLESGMLDEVLQQRERERRQQESSSPLRLSDDLRMQMKAKQF
jgi:hypothetical protein